MRRLLVTGGAGFIGSNFIHYWFKRHPDDYVVVLDMLTYAGNISNFNMVEKLSNFHFIHGDICNHDLVEDILDKKGIDTIVHFAAESHVDRSILGPDAFIQTNIMGTYSLLKTAKKIWVDKPGHENHCFLHVSTDEVFGSLNDDTSLFSETTPYAPSSPYSASKASSDHLVNAYNHTYGLQTVISNCSNNYGPYQFPEKLIPLMIVNILNNKPLPIYGDGKNVRDWLYVEDHCHGIDLVMEKGIRGESYNIGGNNEWKNIDIVKLICKILDDMFLSDPGLKKRFPDAPPVRGEKNESLITFVKDRPGHDLRYAIDAGKIMNKLGYKPEESFETGIHKTIEWYLDNEAWWMAVMDGSYKKWIDKQYDRK